MLRVLHLFLLKENISLHDTDFQTWFKEKTIKKNCNDLDIRIAGN